MANVFSYNDKEFHTGDTIKLHQKVSEGDKTRIQIFEGIIIAIRNSGAGKSFIVRKIGANSIGVEKIMPVMSPTIADIEHKTLGNVRRSKLYYLRDRVGRQAVKVKTKQMPKPEKATESSKKAKAKKASKK